jgi:hypothetical protein
MRARVYVGAAGIDPGFTDEQRQRLDEALRPRGALRDRGLRGAQHGFAVHNHRVYDRAASERHWERLLGCWTPSCGPWPGRREGISLRVGGAETRRLRPRGGTMRSRERQSWRSCAGGDDGAAAEPLQRARARRPGMRDRGVRRSGRLGADQGLLLGLVNAMPTTSSASSRRRAGHVLPNARCTSRDIDIKLFSPRRQDARHPCHQHEGHDESRGRGALQTSFDYGAAVSRSSATSS